jgi:predicted nuclease of restriction endonuclease-like (RecB) superfamily
MRNKIMVPQNLESVYNNIKNVLNEARSKAFRSVNFAMVQAYWHIGRLIVEEEQNGKERADYGESLIQELSKRLTIDYGKGFNKTNLWYMRQFYLTFKNLHALRGELTWTHYRLLLKVENEDARDFYLIESINSNWSTRELERQINSLLYERIALSSDKQKVKELSSKGNMVQKSDDLIKDPYVLEFLGLAENKAYQERDLEQALINRLQDFMLELGKGFSFVGRQKRITVDGDHFYVDLVFYNYELKCFVLIDLKVGKLTHQDIGQMDFYVRYFEKEIKPKGDNPTIGLILCADKNDTMIRYTLLEDSKQIFASRYKLYLPSEEEFRIELEKEKKLLEMEKKLYDNINIR